MEMSPVMTASERLGMFCGNVQLKLQFSSKKHLKKFPRFTLQMVITELKLRSMLVRLAARRQSRQGKRLPEMNHSTTS